MFLLIQQRGAAMSSTAASGFVFLLLFVQVIQSQDGWGVTYASTDVCGVKGSLVYMSSNFSYPSRIKDDDVRKRFWFVQWIDEAIDLMSDPQYSERVEYRCFEKRCDMIIRDLRESDSQVYKSRFTTDQEFDKYFDEPGVTLSVTDPSLQVKVSRFDSTRVDLKCLSGTDQHDDSSYIWYENGEKIKTGPSYSVSFGSSNSYYCAVKGPENICSPSVHAPMFPSVSVSPSTEIVEGSSVTLTCSGDAKPAPSYTWYKGNQQRVGERPQHVFSSIQTSDSGEFYCEVDNQLGMKKFKSIFIDVKYPPRLPSVSVSPSGEIMEGSSVTMNCSSDANPAATYTWYKGKQKLLQGPEGVYLFTSISSEDSGTYYCKSENKHGSIDSSPLVVNVLYAPKLPSVSVSPSDDIVEGSSVTLTCSSDANPPANYTWYKEKQKLPQGPEGVYRFTSISSKDKGTYSCKAENKHGEVMSPALLLNVHYAPKLPSVSVNPSDDIVEGSSVTLNCSSDANPAATYTWYKEKKKLLQGPEGVYLFTSISSKDRGTYYCKSENKHGSIDSSPLVIDVLYAPKLPSVSVSPSAEIMEGSSVTLTCSSDANPAASHTWYKEKQKPLQGPEGVYRFTSISSKDSGIYYCKAENKHGEIMSTALPLNVQYPPRLPSVSVSPSDEIVEGSSVNLTCSSDANPAASYTWYKEKKKLLQGPEGVYRFTSISSKDRGTYYCKFRNKHGSIASPPLVIDVLYAPKLPSVSVSPSQIVEDSSVNLTCSSDANPAANYTWYKEDEDLPKASGHIFIITNFTAEHSGTYSCEAKNTIGRSNSTFHLSVAATAAVVDIIATIVENTWWSLLAVVPLYVVISFLSMSLKKVLMSTTEPSESTESDDDSMYKDISDEEDSDE